MDNWQKNWEGERENNNNNKKHHYFLQSCSAWAANQHHFHFTQEGKGKLYTKARACAPMLDLGYSAITMCQYFQAQRPSTAPGSFAVQEASSQPKHPNSSLEQSCPSSPAASLAQAACVQNSLFFPPNHMLINSLLTNSPCTGCLWSHAPKWRSVSPNKYDDTSVCSGSVFHRKGGVGLGDVNPKGIWTSWEVWMKEHWTQSFTSHTNGQEPKETPMLGTEEGSQLEPQPDGPTRASLFSLFVF